MAAVLLVGLAACAELGDLSDGLFDNRTPRERYEAALAAAGLEGTALAREWHEAARRALAEAPAVALPHAEEGYLAPGEPMALAYRVALRRGQHLQLDFSVPGDSTTQVFLDAWLEGTDSARSPRFETAADSGARALAFEPSRDGTYILRAQPELLRGGRFRLTLRVDGTLAFPVGGRGEPDVGSRWGAPRDGGARSHHGIDIFAPRGTPVVASRAGVVGRVETTPRGGRVIWLRDDRGFSLYYAHLEAQLVEAGQRVAAGDTIGLVGNSGNAVTTPPHLHFGIYRRGQGPVDPWWFVHRPPQRLARLTADTTRLGDWIRTTRAATPLLAEPASRAAALDTLDRHAAARVVAATGSWYRVRMPDGGTGYLPADQIEPAERPISVVASLGTETILTRPSAQPTTESILVSRLAGAPVDVLGRYGQFLLVRTPDGVAGWVSEEE